MKSFISAIAFSSLLCTSLATAPNPGPQWKKTLMLDDFSGPKGQQPGKGAWKYQTGTHAPGGPAQWGTGEIEVYTKSKENVHLDGNGNLVITPLYKNGQWTSARIETQEEDFFAPKGGMMRAEARIKAPGKSDPANLGYWPAFWMLGRGIRKHPKSWPLIGEYDIMEIVNGAKVDGHGLHCGVNPGGPCDEPNGIYQFHGCKGGSCSGEWHTYTVIVDRSVSPQKMHYQIDHVTTFTISEDKVGKKDWDDAVDNGHFIVLNVAMGGALPNARNNNQPTPTSQTKPGHQMLVDYVAVWTT